MLNVKRKKSINYKTDNRVW